MALKFGDRVIIEGAPRMFKCEINGLTGKVLGTGTSLVFVHLDAPSEELQERIRAGYSADKLLLDASHCIIIPGNMFPVPVGGPALEDLVPIALDQIVAECEFCTEPKAPGRLYCVMCCIGVDDAENEGMVN